MSELVLAEGETLLEFPCDFDVKAMGRSGDEFETAVIEIVCKHSGELKQDAVTTKQSSNGKFTSITVMIEATSKEQMDKLYLELTGHELVRYVL